MNPEVKIATLDLETNGFKGRSVLSASSIIFDDQGRIIDFFNRFYFPIEKLDLKAVQIHGLNYNRIHWLRTVERYPEYFKDDISALSLFWDQHCVDGIAVHNLSFDTSFLPDNIRTERKWWCSMLGLTGFCSIPGGRNGYKWPRLEEAKALTAKKLKAPSAVNYAETSMPGRMPHTSLSDCFDLYSISSRILFNKPGFLDFKHLPPGCNPEKRVKVYFRTGSCGLPDRFIVETLKYSLSLARISTSAKQTPGIQTALNDLNQFSVKQLNVPF